MAYHSTQRNTEAKQLSSTDTDLSSAFDKDLLRHLLQVSWRLALPLLGLSLGGNALDGVLHSNNVAAPTAFLATIGLVMGTLAAFLWVRVYMRKHFPDMFHKKVQK